MTVNGRIAKKSSMPVDDSIDIKLEEVEAAFISRADYRLYDVLKPFEIDLEGCVVLDVGANTEGLSDVCLQNKARFAYVVDVGKDQLLERLKNDPRIINIRGVSCHYPSGDIFDPRLDSTCMDVSFISIRQTFPVPAEQFADMEIVALVKPQSEAGRARVGKHDIVKNEKVHIEALQSMHDYAKTLSLRVHHLCTNNVLGKDDNRKFVVHSKYTQTHKVFPIRDVVESYTIRR